MDLKLPDAEGRSTLEKACAQADQLPVVVLTSTDDEALALDAIRGGAADYLVKQRTHALALPGAVLRAIERHRRNGARPATGVGAGICDRIGLHGQLKRALARARRRRTSLAVMAAGYADLDSLRDAVVPAAIERLGAHAAERVALRLRGSDVLARVDTTSLAVVLEGDADRGRLAGIARDLHAVMQGVEIELDHGVVMGFEAQVGVSVHPADGDDAETLLDNATAARHEASPHGGVRFFSRES
jgi:PleD family two-component response regulator